MKSNKLELAYSSEQLRNISADPAKHKDFLSDQEAILLMKRLADLRAADSISELLVGNFQIFFNEDVETCEYVIGEGIMLWFIPNHISPPVNAIGRADWNKITRIKIIKLLCKGGSYE